MSRDSDDAKRTAERVAGEQNVSPEARVAAAQVKATAALVEAVEVLTKMIEKQGDHLGSHIQTAAHNMRH